MIDTKKNILLATAEDLFLKKGYASTSISDILSASHTSKGNLYYHFENKEDLLISVLQRKCELWLEDWTSLNDSASTASDLLYRFASLSAQYLIDPLLVIVYDVSRTEVLKAKNLTILEESLDVQRSMVLDIIQKGIKDGEFKAGNASDIADVVVSTLMGLNAVYDYGDQIENLRKQSKLAIGVLLRGVGA